MDRLLDRISCELMVLSTVRQRLAKRNAVEFYC